jgi:DHA2 family multidrug resistance protein-like MFS transporter
LAVLALPCLVYAMDLTVLNLALPKLSEDLQPSSAQLLWIVDIYGFLVAGLLVTMGTLGDHIGRRRLLLAGAAAFAVASVLAAWSTSAGMLIAARALLGMAGATLAPSTLSLIRNMFADPRQRTVAVSVWITSFAVGGAVGPLVGGVLLEWFWWGSVFLVAVPVMALLLVLGPRLLPEFRDPAAGRLDLASAALSLAAVLAAIYGLKQLAQDGPGWLAVGCMLAGLLVGVGFVRRQRRLADPLIDVRLLGNRAFSAALTTNLLSFFVGFGALLFTAQYLQLVLGLSPLEAGLWSLPSSAGFILGVDGHPAAGAPGCAGCGDGRRPGPGHGRLRAAHPAPKQQRAAAAGHRVGHLLAGLGAGGHPGHRPGCRGRPAGAGRGRLGDHRDQRRVRRRAGHRDPGGDRHCRLPRPDGRGGPGRGPRPGGSRGP